MNTSTESCASLCKPSVIQAAAVLISPRCSAKPVLYRWVDISKAPAPEVSRPFPISCNTTEEQPFVVVIWITPPFLPRSWNVALEQLLVSSSSFPGLISNHEVFPAVGDGKELRHLKTTVLVIFVTVFMVMISRWRLITMQCIIQTVWEITVFFHFGKTGFWEDHSFPGSWDFSGILKHFSTFITLPPCPLFPAAKNLYYRKEQLSFVFLQKHIMSAFLGSVVPWSVSQFVTGLCDEGVFPRKM